MLKKQLKALILGVCGQSLGAQIIGRIQLRKQSVGEQSFAQEGEDRLLANLLKDQRDGFYVDIGAHHPYCLSNTNLFYQRGWRGINIDANPECIKLFEGRRDGDTNLSVGVGPVPGTLKFYKFKEPALSSFDEKLSRAREKEGREIAGIIDVKVLPLSEILPAYVPSGKKIDFMNIDVEGLDLEVLKSNNWHHYRPRYIMVECLGLELEKLSSDPIYAYLKEQGYALHSKLVNSCLFSDSRV